MNFASVFNPKAIFQSWVDSLKIFLPANLISLLSTTFKSFVGGIRVFFVYFLVWVGIFLSIYFFKSYINGLIWGMTFAYKDYAYMLLFFLSKVPFWIFDSGLIFSIRSSVKKKDIAYFKNYLWILPVLIILEYIFWQLVGLIPLFKLDINYVVLEIAFIVIWLIAPRILLFIFIESGRTIKDFFQSFWRTLIFMFLNLPALIVFSVIYLLIMIAEDKIRDIYPMYQEQYSSMHYILGYTMAICAILVYVASICILYIYFIQRVNANKKLYL